jgi:hypothetical protein
MLQVFDAKSGEIHKKQEENLPPNIKIFGLTLLI